jgi:preprotein translocase subunit YajC
MMQPQYYYNLIQSIAYFIAAIVPIYFIVKSRENKDARKSFENISILLIGFILIQGVYHLFGMFGFKLLAKGFLEPLSIIILLLFGLTYFFLYTKKERKSYKFN